MELDELHVAHLGSCPVGEGVAFTSILPRARADLPAASDAPCGQHYCLGLEDVQRAVVAVVGEASRDAPVGLEQSAYGEFHEHIHAHVNSFLL